jgi:hypothetical protein
MRAGNTAAVCKSKVRHSAAAISERESALSVSDPAARGRGCWLRVWERTVWIPARSRHQSCGHMFKGLTHPERS